MWGPGLWKHELSTDVAFEVLRKFYVPEKKVWKLKVNWWNIGACHNPWPLLITQCIEIPEEKCKEWKRFSGRAVLPESKIY